MHPLEHAVSSARRFGGTADDYIAIHHWFDASKEHHATFKHRALRHHSQGIFECERLFGKSITNSAGHEVPVRVIGEQHVIEDLGRIPSLHEWLVCIKPETWMFSRRHSCEDVSSSTTTSPCLTAEGDQQCRSTQAAIAIS